MSYEYIREQHGIDVSIGQVVQSQITGRYGVVRQEGMKKDYIRVQFEGDRFHQNCLPRELEFKEYRLMAC